MRRMESASDRDPGSMPGISGEVAPASDTGRLAGHVLAASRWLPPIAVIALTVVAFLPVLDNGFIPNWDDRTNFLDNPHYRGLGGAQLRWMFTTFHAGHYIPLTWLSLGLDYLLWGLNPAGYHLSSLLLHAATALAFYFLALRLLRAALPPATTLTALRWGAAVAALVFAVHPLRVESVASATERRDVLSGLFYVLALLCYVKAATAPETAPARLEPRWYALALACFAAALLSKSIVVTLPVTLLVLDVYPLRRLGGAAGWRAPRPWLEKLPFFALSAITAIVAFEALLPLGNTKSLQDMPVVLRLLVSVYGLLFYLQKTLLPLDLTPLYPLSFQVTWLQFGVLIGGAYLAWACRRWLPAFTAAAIVYVVTVAPVIGIFQNGPQAAADRYTYLPCLGWAALAGGAVAHWWPRRAIVVPVAAAWLAALAFLTWQQTSLWKDPVRLWSQAAAVTPTMRAAHFKLAQAYAENGRIAEAIAAYREAIRLSGPRAPWGHVAIARLLEQAGLDDAARSEYAEALREDPDYQEACDGLIQMGKRRGGQALAPPSCARRG
jgi:tetratricopeptide (TPR) repeat protein